MSTIVTRFSKCLTAIEYPKEKTSWNIAGIIKGKNAFCRFEEENDWVIFDMNELHKHVKKHKLKKVYLNDLIKTLEWNIRIKKWGT